MKYTASDQLMLDFETYGDSNASPAVLIHGIGADHNMWKPQIRSFPAAGLFTIVPDLRGHGLSEIPQSFKMADCVRDLRDLLDVLGVQRAHLVGVSMGGMVAQQFVADYPDRAISQVIVDSLSGATRLIERFNAGLAAFLLKFFPAKLQAAMMRAAYKKQGHEEVGAYFEERLLAADPRWLLMARQEVNQFNILDKLPAMQVPTLVLVGDAFGNLAINMARTTAERIPGAKFQVLEGGGDPSNLLVPKLFDQRVIAFLNQHKE